MHSVNAAGMVEGVSQREKSPHHELARCNQFSFEGYILQVCTCNRTVAHHDRSDESFSRKHLRVGLAVFVDYVV